MRRLTAALLRCALVLGLLLAAAGCGDPERPRVTIMVPWSDNEFKAFYSVITEFERKTDIDVDVQVTRALTQQLDAAVAAGAPPDLAMLPSVGAIHTYAGKELQPLDIDTDSFVQPFRGLATAKGKVYAVPVKADVKSLVWYNREFTGTPPASWPALRKLSANWCLGLESGPTSGWPGADWIADILLAQNGADTYRKWLAGRNVLWNSKPVSEAWTLWMDLVHDNADDATTKRFGEAARGMTGPSPVCSLGHGALSAMDFPTAPGPGTYAYVTPPPDRALEVSADYVGMFTKGNASAEQLIAELASEEAQQAWVNAPGSYALSANEHVTRYDRQTQADIAELLQPGSRHMLCFSAADAMNPDVSAAFYRAVLDYTKNSEPAELTQLLTSLDRVQSKMGSSPVAARLCSTP